MNNEIIKEHYYGDVIRIIFVIAGVVMLFMLPFFTVLIKSPVVISILAILVLAIIAGALNPTQLSVIVLNTLAAVVGCAVFEYYAVSIYISPVLSDLELSRQFFWANQILALLFFIAIYLGVKSIRGKVLSK